VAFSPDGKLVATGSGDKTARVFEAANGSEVSRLTHQDRVVALAFSPDGKLVATGSWDKTARVFEAASGREVSRLAHQAPAYAVAFSPDGKLVATASWDKTARVFEAASGREVSRLPHQDIVIAVAFSPDGKFLITQTGDWLHFYEQDGNRWRPLANRYLPLIWYYTLRTPQTGCLRCVEVVRDIPETELKLDRISVEPYPPAPLGDPKKLVAEWSEKLGLKFDPQGRIVPR
jgi:roadblock/LC7 domain-containing protein